MVAITLPDGSVKEFDGATTVMQVAESIGPGLAKATVAGRVDGKLVLPEAVQILKMKGTAASS